MEREAIERLAIDSAAGELNQDAEALFRTYLIGHAEAKQWAEDMRLICEKTEAAINTKTTRCHAGDQTRFIKPNQLLQINWPRLARWAAALMFVLLSVFQRVAGTEVIRRIELFCRNPTGLQVGLKPYLI